MQGHYGEDSIVKLKRRYLEPGAVVNYTQVGHHQTAVEYAVAGIHSLHDANVERLGGGPFNQEMEGTMKAWVIETLLQGAYLREYHLWEKDCKAYFATMAERNGQKLTVKKGHRFTDVIREVLSAFSVVVPNEALEAIDEMRVRVNVMKHDAGLELDHFIDEADYTRAITALETFWETLANCEEVSYGR
jgi:hypothetical protein